MPNLIEYFIRFSSLVGSKDSIGHTIAFMMLVLVFTVMGRGNACLRGLTFELTGPEQWDGICASVFAGTNSGTLCRVRLSEWLGSTRAGKCLCEDSILM